MALTDPLSPKLWSRGHGSCHISINHRSLHVCEIGEASGANGMAIQIIREQCPGRVDPSEQVQRFCSIINN